MPSLGVLHPSCALSESLGITVSGPSVPCPLGGHTETSSVQAAPPACPSALGAEGRVSKPSQHQAHGWEGSEQSLPFGKWGSEDTVPPPTPRRGCPRPGLCSLLEGFSDAPPSRLPALGAALAVRGHTGSAPAPTAGNRLRQVLSTRTGREDVHIVATHSDPL